METLSLTAKVRVFFPRLLMGLVLCSGYLGLLHVLFVLPHRGLLWEENTVTFVIPLLSAWVWIFLMRNTFRYFERVGRYSTALLRYYAFFFLLIGNMGIQSWIHQSAGSVQTIAKPSALKVAPFYTTYRISNWQLDTTQITDIRHYTVTGKLKTDLNLHMTVLVPLVDKGPLQPNKNPTTWLTIPFSETVVNAYDSDLVKQKKLDAFCKKKYAEVRKTNYSYAAFHRLDKHYERKTYRNVTQEIKGRSGLSFVILEGLTDEPGWMNAGIFMGVVFFVLFFGGIGLVLLQVARPLPPELRVGLAFEDYCAQLDKATWWIDALLPTYRYQFTPWLLILSLVFYLFRFVSSVSVFSFGTDELIAMGALVPQSLSWRLLTYPWVESNLFAFGFQLLSWYYLGQLLEPVVPWQKRLPLFLGCALLSGVLHVMWSSAPCYTGATGATMGWYGMLVALWYDSKWDYWEKAKYTLTFRWVIAFFLVSLLCGMMSTEEDLAAYFICFVVGMFYTVVQKNTLLFPDIYIKATPSSEHS